MTEIVLRHSLLAAPLLGAAAMPAAFAAASAGVDPSMTQVVQSDAIQWKQLYNFPEGTAEQAPMFSHVGDPGQYFGLCCKV